MNSHNWFVPSRIRLQASAFCLMLTLALLLAAGATPLRAASLTWAGANSGLWSDTGNWSGSPVPGTPGGATSDVATFNSAGNGNTSINLGVGIGGTRVLNRIVIDSGAAAYTFGAGVADDRLQFPNGGGITVDAGVSTTQDFTQTSYLRPAIGTVTFSNSGTGLLRLPEILNAATSGSGNARVVFAGTGQFEVAQVNNRTSGRTTSILLNSDVTVTILNSGDFSGTDGDGNSISLRRGVLSVDAVANSGVDSPLGAGGRIEFGYSGYASEAATLQFTGLSGSTNRAFRIDTANAGDGHTAVFDITQAAGTLEITSAITQDGGRAGHLRKTGAGTLILSGDNAYTGTTQVSAGTLVVNGAHTGGLYTVASGATLSGSGTITANSAISGRLASGNSVGTLGWNGDQTWFDGAGIAFEIDDAQGAAGASGGPGWDLNMISGTLDLTNLSAGGFQLDVTSLLTGGGDTPGAAANFDPSLDYAWQFVSTSSVLGFDESLFAIDASGFQNSLIGVYGAGAFSVSHALGQGLYLTYTSAVPEPSTLLLSALGLGAALLWRKRRG